MHISPLPRAIRTNRITRTHKISAAVVAAASCTAALVLAVAPANTGTTAFHTTTTAKPVRASGLPLTARDHQMASSLTAGLKFAAVAKQGHTARQVANRSANRTAIARKTAPKRYANNLDGWIRQSLEIMKAKGIPGTYQGLRRNIMRESGGNPNAVNNWDINAIDGIPSKGLLQVIQPTFNAYHVSGTPDRLTDPVANITAAANYAAHRYGSIDNVNSSY